MARIGLPSVATRGVYSTGSRYSVGTVAAIRRTSEEGPLLHTCYASGTTSHSGRLAPTNSRCIRRRDMLMKKKNKKNTKTLAYVRIITLLYGTARSFSIQFISFYLFIIFALLVVTQINHWVFLPSPLPAAVRAFTCIVRNVTHVFPR